MWQDVGVSLHGAQALVLILCATVYSLSSCFVPGTVLNIVLEYGRSRSGAQVQMGCGGWELPLPDLGIHLHKLMGGRHTEVTGRGRR